MKISTVKNIEELFQIIDHCNGRVELVTGEGDRLNLKSKLCQCVSMASILSNEDIPDLEIIAYDKEDISNISNYLSQN